MCRATILNTRPIWQAQYTADVFRQHGFAVIDFPCIEIANINNTATIIKKLNSSNPKDVIIFTSQHAVTHAFKINPTWQISDTAIVIAVGEKTAQCLEQNSHWDIWTPKQHNSAGVIELLKGIQSINAIQLITAKYGRDLIQKYATASGITLQQINVYKRQVPKPDKEVIQQIAQTDNLLVLATSVTTLMNLQILLPNKLCNQIQASQLICVSDRIAATARAMGFLHIENLATTNMDKLAKLLHSSFNHPKYT
ncbi:hypothetical protein MNBD_GAMMA01-1095 [hydrothermal vent metagenome]|uniref:uroporphyrinogen-III synthase n=1 Tax=hydrothermal vent metagenome TaxID=652676 RepID=A0A3B0WFC0_9ZZZZ